MSGSSGSLRSPELADLAPLGPLLSSAGSVALRRIPGGSAASARAASPVAGGVDGLGPTGEGLAP